MALLPWSTDITNNFFESDHLWDWHNFDRDFQHDLNMLVPSWSLVINKHFRHRVPRLFTVWRNMFDYDTSETKFNKNGFHVSLDVKDYLPNEISVKTVDNALVIEAKHEEHKDDRSYSSRQFKRRYVIPRGFDMDDVHTQLSSDGILTMKVPRERNAIEYGNVRELKIEKTGPVRCGSRGKT